MVAPIGFQSSHVGLYGSDFSEGAMVGPYIVERLWHRGELATLYQARHERSGALAALKVLHQQLAHSGKMLKRFQQESDALKRLRHPNIVDILESGELRDGRPFIATEWLQGQTLSEEVEQRGSFSAREVVLVMQQIGAALGAAHALGIIHRDLKASNVIALRSGDGFTVKLLDFGIAKFLDPTFGAASGLTSTGAVLGSPISMAPEQIRGEPSDERTDIYALGVLLYQLLTGQPPFRGASYVEVEEMHLHSPAPRPSASVPSAARFDSLVARCLEKDRAARFASVAMVIDEVKRVFDARADLTPRTRAIGLYVEVRSLAEGDAFEETDERLETLLESARQACERSSMALALDTGESFLAVSPLPTDEGAERDAREQILAMAIATYDRLPAMENGAPVRVSFLLHVAPLSSDVSFASSFTPADGDLIAVSQWVPSNYPPGLLASSSVLRGLEHRFRVAPSPDGSPFCSVSEAARA